MEDSCRLERVMTPCRATGCCGRSTRTPPTLRRAVAPCRPASQPYRAWDLPTLTRTTVLEAQTRNEKKLCPTAEQRPSSPFSTKSNKYLFDICAFIFRTRRVTSGTLSLSFRCPSVCELTSHVHSCNLLSMYFYYDRVAPGRIFPVD